MQALVPLSALTGFKVVTGYKMGSVQVTHKMVHCVQEALMQLRRPHHALFLDGLGPGAPAVASLVIGTHLAALFLGVPVCLRASK